MFRKERDESYIPVNFCSSFFTVSIAEATDMDFISSAFFAYFLIMNQNLVQFVRMIRSKVYMKLSSFYSINR